MNPYVILNKIVVVLAAVLLAGCAATNAEAPKKDYVFWPTPPEVPHIQYLTGFNGSADLAAKNSPLDSFLLGKEGDADRQWYIIKPYGLRMWGGKIYVCDTDKASVAILDLRKREVRLLGVNTAEALTKPVDLAISPDGYKYVADGGKSAVVAFDANDKYVRKIGHPGLRPTSVAVYKNELYVASLLDGCVEVYDRFSGELLRKVGEKGSKEGQLAGVMGIALDKDGNLYTTEIVTCRVQKFNRDGKFVMKVGGIGANVGSFVRPKHLAVDSQGIIYVVDAAFNNVQMFNAAGEILLSFGTAPHEGNLDMPAGICVVDEDLDLFQPFVHPAFKIQRVILVSNQFGEIKVSAYALGELRPGKTVADLTHVVDTGKAATADPAGPKEAFERADTRTLPRDLLGGRGPTSLPTTAPATAPTPPNP